MRVRADRLIRMRWRQAFVHGPTLAFASICWGPPATAWWMSCGARTWARRATGAGVGVQGSGRGGCRGRGAGEGERSWRRRGRGAGGAGTKDDGARVQGDQALSGVTREQGGARAVAVHEAVADARFAFSVQQHFEHGTFATIWVQQRGGAGRSARGWSGRSARGWCGEECARVVGRVTPRAGEPAQASRVTGPTPRAARDRR